MIDQKTLGRRIRYFRKRAGVSQLELEMEIGASAGMLSRIESGKVNPSKETVRRIVDALGMSADELDYLIGITSIPARDEEIKEAIDFVKDYFDDGNVFAYLIDERFRIFRFSEGFKRLFSPFVLSNPEKLEHKLYGVSIARLMLDNRLQIAPRLNMNKHVLKHQLARYYYRYNYMFDDPIILNAVEYIKSHPEASRVWEFLQSNSVNVNSLHSKYIDFEFGVFNIKLSYATESLPNNLGRFQTLEYFPEGRLLKFMKKLKK